MIEAEINCPECGGTVKFNRRDLADWGTGYIQICKCEDCGEEIKITVSVDSPED